MNRCANCGSSFVRPVPARWWQAFRLRVSARHPHACWHCGWTAWLPPEPPHTPHTASHTATPASPGDAAAQPTSTPSGTSESVRSSAA